MRQSPGVDQESALLIDARFLSGINLFNSAEWYACHDAFESLWHEQQGPLRTVLQGLLQIAVGELHLERGNRQGAILLMGEGLGRLSRSGDSALGLDLDGLRRCVRVRLLRLQDGGSVADLPVPQLRCSTDHTR